MKAVGNSLGIRNQRLNPGLSLNFMYLDWIYRTTKVPFTYSTTNTFKEIYTVNNIHSMSEDSFDNYPWYTKKQKEERNTLWFIYLTWDN